MKRRQLLKGLAMTSVAASVASCTRGENEAVDAGVEADHEVEFLFVQNAIAATLSEGVLSMIGITPETLYFSDRPDRIVGRVTTREFVDHWSKGEDSFEANPPNAVLSTLQGPNPQDVVVVLREPRLGDNALFYNVEVLDGVPEIEGGASALFIDIIGRPLTPLSVGGVRRRTRRRTRRRVR
jgi:hypothetical protein